MSTILTYKDNYSHELLIVWFELLVTPLGTVMMLVGLL